MVRLAVLCAALGAGILIRPTPAEVVDSVTFTGVFSTSVEGDPANDLFFFDTSATTEYTLGAIAWDGLVVPTEDLNAGMDDPRFPTFGSELRVLITHELSGDSASLVLGTNGVFGPEATPFSGSSLGLNGTLVRPGDSFTFEFFESFDDEEVNPDAIWDTITFNFDNDFIPPLEPPGPDVIRFDTTGTRSWRTEPEEPGAEFYGVEYGAGGTGPSITNVRLEGHDFFTFWFDLRTDLGIDDGGQFRANVLEGVTEPTVTFLDEDPDFAETFGTLELTFANGEFGPGDRLRFGVLTSSDDFGFNTTGEQMAQLEISGPLSITVTFEDGTKVTAPLTQITPGIEDSGFVDLDGALRVAATGGDTDGDLDVDADDLLNILVGFGVRSGALPADGDVDGQGDVDDDDLAVVLANLGTGVPPQGALASSAAVPEGQSWQLLLIAMLSASAWCRLRCAPTGARKEPHRS